MSTATSPDIRDKKTITHDDILRLNFIRTPSKYFFRGHFQEGLRSRIMQVLGPEDVKAETQGFISQGIRRYPLARPLWMLRIFRKQFTSLDDIEHEIRNYKIIQTYLPAAYYAASSEFLVDYEKAGRREIVLCGLQEFVNGEPLDLWNPGIMKRVNEYYRDRAPGDHNDPDIFTAKKIDVLQRHTQAFVKHLKHLIDKTHCIPDLAGVGNILFTMSATIHLVDINNISKISRGKHIQIDDKGYPACDKSIEALSLLEKRILGRPIDMQNELYRFFLNPERMRRVRDIEKRFHTQIAARGN